LQGGGLACGLPQVGSPCRSLSGVRAPTLCLLGASGRDGGLPAAPRHSPANRARAVVVRAPGAGPTSAERVLLTLPFALLQIFPLSPGPRWQSSSARPAALALQQALGQELARVRQGSPEVTGVTVRLLQAIATLLNSPHSGALVMSMHRSHFLACPLMRQLCQYQVGACGRARGPRGSAGATREGRCASSGPRVHPQPSRALPSVPVLSVCGPWCVASRGRRKQAPTELGVEPAPLFPEAFQRAGGGTGDRSQPTREPRILQFCRICFSACVNALMFVSLRVRGVSSF